MSRPDHLAVAVSVLRCLAMVLAASFAATGFASGFRIGDAPPHLAPDGNDAYRQFLAAVPHRAFAIAPGGAWGWEEGAASADDTAEATLAACGDNTRQTCVLYAVDKRLVFDARAWVRLWGPYADEATAQRAPAGRLRGERFPDLAFTDAGGRPGRVSSLRGKVAVLHFWGSWCKPCRQEMPQLQTLSESLRDRGDVTFVLLQTREPFAVSRRWAFEQGLRLPLFDSGSRGEEDAQFRLAGGGSMRDREVAAVFPTTYVLDKRGLVVFSHVGPVSDWSQYKAFLLDAARRSGR